MVIVVVVIVVVVVPLAAAVLFRPRAKLLGGDEALGDEQLLEGREPPLVVGRLDAVTLCDRNLIDQTVDELPPFVAVVLAQAHCDAKGAAFPRRLEDELAVAARQRLAPSMLEICRSVSQLTAAPYPTPAGAAAFATPTIASRDTSGTSSASLRRSVPAGRSGSTI